MRFLLLFMAALAWAHPASANPTLTEQAPSLARVEAEMVAYGAWRAQVAEIQAPLQAELSQIGSRWQEAMRRTDLAAGAASFRPVVASALTAIANTNARLRVLQPPVTSSLQLPDDIRPEIMLTELIRTNTQAAAVVESYRPLLDAVLQRDEQAALTAVARMMGGLELVLDSQVLLMRAGMATIPREQAAWEMQNVQLLYLRAMGRALSAWPRGGVAQLDPALAGDLRALAAELSETREEGGAKLEEEIARLSEELAVAQHEYDPTRASILRRAVAVLTVERDIFVMADDLAGSVRSAADLAGSRVTFASLLQIIQLFQPYRGRIDEIIRREAAAMATAGE